MSGQDILDQAAGTTPFVHDYLHIDWDGSEVQNDKATVNVTRRDGQPGRRRRSDAVHAGPRRPRSQLRGPDHARSTRPPPRSRTTAARPTADVTDTGTSGTTYHVVFLAFPLEAFGIGGDKSTLVQKAVTFFGP